MACVYETPAHAVSAEIDKFSFVYNQIKKTCGKEHVLVDQMDKAAHKLQPFYFASQNKRDDSGKAIIIVDRKTSSPRDLMEESRVLNGIVEPINIRRIYVDKSVEEKARRTLKGLLEGR